MSSRSERQHQRSTTSRRAAVGGLLGLLGAVVSGGPALAAGERPRAKSLTEATAHADDVLLGFDVRDFGAVRGGSVDCTAAFQAAVKAAAYAYGRVLVPNGTWLVNGITVPKLVKVIGLGADISYYASTATHSGGATLVRDPGAATPMLTVDGHGVTLENLTLLGKGGAAPLLTVKNGFESRFSRLRLHGVAGTALQVDQVNNNTWDDVFINDSGSAAQAAMVVRSPKTATNSNTMTCTNLTIEGSANVALDIGWGNTSQDFVEFVRLIALHVETDQTAGNDPVIRIGNVRSVELTSPLVYGGPGPLIQHRETAGRGAVLRGGVRLLGGTLLGLNAKKSRVSDVLVDLASGDDFAAIGTRFGQFSTSAIRVHPEYGARVVASDDLAHEGYDGVGVPAVRPLVDDRRA